MNIGDVSGCLEVIGNCAEANFDLQDIVKEWAEKEWNKFSDWSKWDYNGNFKTYYKLTKLESELYDAEQIMPESFVNKYIKKGENEIYSSPKFLYHKKKPNTIYELKKAYKKGKLYKVKCKICNRIFLMDSDSFNCVKWRSCIGVECLANTVNEKNIDFSKSMYDWSSMSTALQVLDTQLAKVEEISNPLTYYGASNRYNVLKIAYISDIHLMHHLKFYNDDENQMIRDIVNKLYASMRQARVIVFGGDISSDPRLTMTFYKSFMRKYDYELFLNFKKEALNMKHKKETLLKCDNSRFIRKLDKITTQIECEREKLSEHFDFALFERYRNNYHLHLSYEKAFECYKKVKTYKSFMFTDDIEKQILKLAKMLDVGKKCEVLLDNYNVRQKTLQQDIELYEELHGKTIEEINITDYNKHKLLSSEKDVFAVLGNHEYVNFSNVDECVSFFESELSKIGIKLLHNNEYVYDKFMIFGGTGFAKYDEKWNADKIVCCPNFTREDEFKETALFESKYAKALNHARENGLCFLCVSHYPVSACLNNHFDIETIYFTGHNHQNQYIKTSNKVLFADNQIGYRNNNITFKLATTGYETNPYALLNDGLYQTAIKDYLQFYHYIGEDIGKGNMLYQRCQDGKANLYVVKRKGYYGFFIVNPIGSSKGISIVNGGKTKKISNSTDIRWICENFDIVLSKYLQVLLPLRTAQEQLSKELIELGLSGTIHGCIVDIDFYHHIMLNPVDGILTYYYSPSFGIVTNLNDFEEVIKSLDYHNDKFFPHDCKSIRKKYDKAKKNTGYLLSMPSNNYLISSEENKISDITERKEQLVSRKDGMYGVSRKVNPLQRLFSGHVLRDFDLRLTETKQQAYRKYLYTDRMFMFEGVTYKVIEDNGCDIIIAEEVEGVNEDTEIDSNAITLTGKTRKFAISALKSKIASSNGWDTYWITTK